MGSSVMAQEILLESGTNEVELLEFYLGKQPFGVNVLKIRQIVRYEPEMVNPVPKSYPSIAGTFLYQGKSTTLIDLNQHLFNRPSVAKSDQPQVVLICEFNQLINGFLVDGVDRIHRLSWDHIQPPPKTLVQATNRVTGIAVIEKREVLMPDFESIVADIVGDLDSNITEKISAATNLSKKARREKANLFIADDSQMFRKLVQEHLTRINYTNLNIYDDGQQLYKAVMEIRKKANQRGTVVTSMISAIITDIEMPVMDGLTMCKAIKTEMPEVPVIVLSSLINEQIAHKCKEVFADAYLSKRDVPKLIELLDKYCTTF